MITGMKQGMTKAMTTTKSPVWRHLMRGRLITSTALVGVFGVVGWSGAALAADVEITSDETSAINMDVRHAGGGTMLLGDGVSLSVTSNTTNAIKTSVGNPWTFQIDGTIRADGAAGGIESHANDTITVGASGVIESTNGGSPVVASQGGLTIENSGRISGDEYSVFLINDSLSLTNHAGATIEGTVQMATGGTSSTIDNYGSISGRNERSALHLEGDATIHNRAGATMTSDYSVIEVYNGVGSLDNAGSITSTNASALDASAVLFYQSGTVTNASTGTMSADTGVWLGNGSAMSSDKATLTNHGSISGTKYHGALFYNINEASLTNTNTGTIVGVNSGAFFYGLTTGDINNSGTIRGASGLYITNDGTLATNGSVTILNSGTIEGTGTYAIAKGSTISYDLTLDTGSNLIGQVMADSGDTLTLKGTSNENEDLKGFGSLTMNGSTWTLSGGVQADTLNVTSGALTLSSSDLSFGSITIGGTGAAKLMINGGSGTIGGVTVNSGGTLAPGNSIGTLNVAGNATFNAGSTYEVEVDKNGNSDKIVSTGTMTIDNGATLKVLAENGTDDGSTYAANTAYTILSAASLSGEFGTVTENFAYLDASVAYSGTDATLTLSRADSFSDQAKTPNQHGTADAVESLGGSNPLYQAVETLPDGEPASALNQLTGEQHSNVQTGLITNITPDRVAANQRLRSSMGGIGGSGDQIFYGFHGEVDNQPLETTLTPQMWGQAFGSWGEIDATPNTARVTRQNKGFLVGADAEIWSGWRTGIFAGYSSTSSKATGTSSKSDIDNYHAGLYVGTQWEVLNGTVDLNMGTSSIWHQVDTERTVAFTGFSDHLTSDYSAATSQAFAELGYTYELDRVRLQPFVGAALIHQWSDGFTESGGAAALNASEESKLLGMTSLGVRSDILLGRFNGVEAALNASATWQHAVGDVDSSTSMRFASGGEAFTVAGSPIDRDAAFVEAGLSLDRGSDLSFGVSYQGTFSDNAKDQGFKLGVKYQF